MRWDPKHPTAAAGKKAWAELVEKHSSLPPMDEAGVPQQQVRTEPESAAGLLFCPRTF